MRISHSKKSVEVLEKIYPEKGRGSREDSRLYNYSLQRNVQSMLLQRGIIIPDTKFEFGPNEQGEVVLADEMLTLTAHASGPLMDISLDRDSLHLTSSM